MVTVEFLIPEVSAVVEQGNMTDAEYIAALENELQKRGIRPITNHTQK